MLNQKWQRCSEIDLLIRSLGIPVEKISIEYLTRNEFSQIELKILKYDQIKCKAYFLNTNEEHD